MRCSTPWRRGCEPTPSRPRWSAYGGCLGTKSFYNRFQSRGHCWVDVSWGEARVEADGWALNEAYPCVQVSPSQTGPGQRVLILNTGQRTDCNLCTVAPALLWQHRLPGPTWPQCQYCWCRGSFVLPITPEGPDNAPLPLYGHRN